MDFCNYSSCAFMLHKGIFNIDTLHISFLEWFICQQWPSPLVMFVQLVWKKFYVILITLYLVPSIECDFFLADFSLHQFEFNMKQWFMASSAPSTCIACGCSYKSMLQMHSIQCCKVRCDKNYVLQDLTSSSSSLFCPNILCVIMYLYRRATTI